MFGDFNSMTIRPCEGDRPPVSGSGADPCRRTDVEMDVLLDLTGVATRTMVEAGSLQPGRPTRLAEPQNVRAVLVLVCLDECGSLTLACQGQTKLVRPAASGTVLLLDPRERHMLTASGGVRVVCFGIPYRALDQLIRRSEATRMVSPAALLDGGEQFFFDDTVRSLALSSESVLASSDDASALFQEQLAYAVAAHLLLRRCAHESPPAWRGGLAPWQLAKAKKLVLADLGKTVQASELAEACGLSPSHFARAFRRSTGTSPHAWLVDRRLAHAKHLMRSSNARLADIALECGFADQSHLTRVFSREEGISPGSWRRYAGPAAAAEGLAAVVADTASQAGDAVHAS